MPTQEGRQAIVIFPPDPESIVDIRDMYGGSHKCEEPHIQSLQRFAVSVGGDGTFLLQAHGTAEP